MECGMSTEIIKVDMRRLSWQAICEILMQHRDMSFTTSRYLYISVPIHLIREARRLIAYLEVEDSVDLSSDMLGTLPEIKRHGGHERAAPSPGSLHRDVVSQAVPGLSDKPLDLAR